MASNTKDNGSKINVMDMVSLNQKMETYTKAISKKE